MAGLLIAALFGPLSLLMLALTGAMVGAASWWLRQGRASFHAMSGGLSALRHVAKELDERHPIRRRLEAAPVTEVSLEEIAQLLTGRPSGPAAEGLLTLVRRVAWMERFAQYAVHLGILGTVLGLVLSDPTDLVSFRARLPVALGTTFWGIIGALILSSLAGRGDDLVEMAKARVRIALLNSYGRVESESETKE